MKNYRFLLADNFIYSKYGINSLLQMRESPVWPLGYKSCISYDSELKIHRLPCSYLSDNTFKY